MKTESKKCPECQAPLEAGAAEGLCPRCLLEQVAVATDVGDGAGVTVEAPELALLNEVFPELEVHELIGQGGMGAVYKATQLKVGRTVALKVLPAALAKNPEFAERFTREAQVLAQLSHPNIVTLFDFGEREGIYYLILEYVDGVNLRQAMAAERFTPQQALKVVPKICEALEYAHEHGVLHRDIKPANVLLNRDGNVKLADFGIAKLGADQPGAVTLTRSGGVLGTPQYMAPEQIEKPSDVDHRADIYSLGVVLYEMLTGELPIGRFAAPSEKSTAEPELDRVVLRALEKEREARQQSAGEMRTEVETAGTSLGSNPPVGSAPATASMSPPVFWVVAAVLVMVVWSAGWDLYRGLTGAYSLSRTWYLIQNESVFRVLDWFVLGGVFGFVLWKRKVALDGLPYRRTGSSFSLYPLALLALLLVVANQLMLYSGTGLVQWFSQGTPIVTFLLTIALVNRSEVAPDGQRISPILYRWGVALLVWGVVSCLLHPLLSLPSWSYYGAMESTYRGASEETVQFSRSSFGFVAPLILFVPIGLALIVPSRVWRVVGIYFGCSILLGWFMLLVFQLGENRTGDWQWRYHDTVWLISNLIVPLIGLVLLVWPGNLAHFGLVPRRLSFFSIGLGSRRWLRWPVFRVLLLLVGLGLVAWVGYFHAVDRGWINPPRYRVSSYPVQWEPTAFDELRDQDNAANLSGIQLVGLADASDLKSWWDPRGTPLDAVSLGRDLSRHLTPKQDGTFYFLWRFDEDVPKPFEWELVFDEVVGDESYETTAFQVLRLDQLHWVVGAKLSHRPAAVQARLKWYPEGAHLVARSGSGRKRQESRFVRFEWHDQLELGFELCHWIEDPDSWEIRCLDASFEPAEDVTVEGESIVAEFTKLQLPFSQYRFLARRIGTVIVPEVLLNPVQ